MGVHMIALSYGEPAQQLRTLAVLPEDLGLVPSTPVSAGRPAYRW